MTENTPAPEQWLPLPGHEGLYDVSDQGRVRSHRRRGSAGRLKKFYMDPKDGYACLVLYRDNLPGKRNRVHVLVAAAFLGPRPEGMYVCHKDGNPANNVIGNLYYGTPSDNTQDMQRHGRDWQLNKTHCVRGHEFTPENTYQSRSQNHRHCRTCVLALRRERAGKKVA